MSNVFSKYTNTVFSLLKAQNNDLYNYLNESNIETVWVSHDGWNGGIDFYNLVIHIPVELFGTLRNNGTVEETEKTILAVYNDAMRGEDGPDYIQEVLLRPTADNIFSIGENIDESMWKPDMFRLFISHLSENKVSASNLKQCILHYGIDGFVAHEDIMPSKEWETTIEDALFTMDALCAIVVPEFINSEWCDQEIGIALGQKKLVIPIGKDALPYGFFGKYQALKGYKKTANEIAQEIWSAIISNNKTRTIYMSKLIKLILNAKNTEEATQFISVLLQIENTDKQFIEYLYTNFSSNSILHSQYVLDAINPLFKKYGLALLEPGANNPESISNDELPF